MIYYIRIDRLNGRNDFSKLAENLASIGVINVEYNKGGWSDSVVSLAYPHLKFEDESEAIIYALKYGGEVTQSLPTKT